MQIKIEGSIGILLIVILTALTTWIIVGSNASAISPSLKIAFVDAQKAMDNHPQFKQIEIELTDMYNARRDALNILDAEIKALEKKVADKTATDNEIAMLSQKKVDFRSKLDEYQAEIDKRKKELQDKMLVDIQRAINEVGGEQGYDMIFSRVYVAYASPQHDLTEVVLERIRQDLAHIK